MVSCNSLGIEQFKNFRSLKSSMAIASSQLEDAFQQWRELQCNNSRVIPHQAIIIFMHQAQLQTTKTSQEHLQISNIQFFFFFFFFPDSEAGNPTTGGTKPRPYRPPLYTVPLKYRGPSNLKPLVHCQRALLLNYTLGSSNSKGF